MKKITKFWTKKDGSKIRICDMEDSHIINTIKLLVKKSSQIQNEALMYYPCFQGDMAQMCAEQEWDNLNEMHPEDFALQEFPILEYLWEEADKRKLKYE